jgi:hypothetical protein
MTTPPAPEIRGLDQLLALPDNGQYLPVLMQDNTDLLDEITNFSQAYGAKASGKLTIEISYSTDRFGQIDIAVQHKVAAPKPPKSKATAWRADGGGLTVANPNQRAMQIREVGGRRELRSPSDDI